MPVNVPIHPDAAHSLTGLFLERLRRTPNATAYHYYDSEQWNSLSWQAMADEIGRWQTALEKEDLNSGDRVGIMLRNCCEWVAFDLAALGLGLVTVPLYTNDRSENAAHIIQDAGIKLLFLEGRRQWQEMKAVIQNIASLERIICLKGCRQALGSTTPASLLPTDIDDWLQGPASDVKNRVTDTNSLATIVYTSGTTGKPKGVMLSHANLLNNAWAACQTAPLSENDVFLSFLPLSHALERTAGYYMTIMVGAQVAFARSVQLLADDLKTIRPTVLISVPRIYEAMYARIKVAMDRQGPLSVLLFKLAVAIGGYRFEYQQGRRGWHPVLLVWPLLDKLVAEKVRARLGGRLGYAICGGAPLAKHIARTFIHLGIPIYQGYGTTESSPVVSVNKPGKNQPESIGIALPGTEVRTGKNDELLTRSKSVMLGYWNNDEATRNILDEEGWLHTGDQARIEDSGHIYIIGRIKEIIVLSNGEKVPPADIESALCGDALFEQAMVVGEGKPYLAALLVVNPEEWKIVSGRHGWSDDDKTLQDANTEKVLLKRIRRLLAPFPGYAQIRKIHLLREPWTIESGMLTPTLKMKRNAIMERYATEIDSLLQEHDI